MQLNQKSKLKQTFTNNQIREIILNYLYNRNANAKSERSDKSGAAVKISAMRKDLKASHGLSQSEVRSNLTYLISQGWIEIQTIDKVFSSPRGGMIPSSTLYYIITAAGIDKIEGPGEFTMSKFQGIQIEATGQNIITVGDGNQVNSHFADAGESLADLKSSLLLASSISDVQKMEAVGDIDSMQSQLAKPKPNKSVLSTLWQGVQQIATLAGVGEKLLKLNDQISQIISG